MRHPIEVKLSERERQVLILCALGLERKEIAKTLRVSEHTIATHLRHLYRKTGLHKPYGRGMGTRALLVAYAITFDWIPAKQLKRILLERIGNDPNY